MRSVQDYRKIFREIASNLNLQGDSVELLVQLIAQATYIGEVENAVYMKESSLEGATLINSKIQHCMNNMYSVFRGSCPRVLLKFRPNKYYSLNPYDIIVESNNFKVYYLGYWKEGEDLAVEIDNGNTRIPAESGFHYGPVTILPEPEGGNDIVLIGFLASEIVEKTWSPNTNTIYLDCDDENLSEDMYVKIDDTFYNTTRNFDEHILKVDKDEEGNTKNLIFDLTTTSYGSRLYIPQNITQQIYAKYFKRTTLSNCNTYELKKIAMSGSEMTSFLSNDYWTEWTNSRGYDSEIATGVILIESVYPDTIGSIHYKASKDRFVSSIIRSNSDIGTVLEEYYPRKIVSGGTTYKMYIGDSNTNVLYIYYIPEDENNLLTSAEIDDFIQNRKAYYITDSIIIRKGTLCSVTLDIDVNLYQNTSVEEDIESILSNYEKKFGLDFYLKEKSETLSEIKALIGKISNISKVNDLSITIPDIKSGGEKSTYYSINFSVHTKL